MPGRPESSKQTLRYLAAARFYLPVTLKGGDKFAVDEQYLDYLHKLAAEHMGLRDKATECRRNARAASGSGDA